MIGLAPVYALIGIVLAATAWLDATDRAHPRRLTSASFWAILAVLFLAGDHLPKALVGGLVLAVALVAGCGGVRAGSQPAPDETARRASAQRLGHRLLWPALSIPALTVAFLWLANQISEHARDGEPLLDKKQGTLVCLAAACVVALVAACRVTRSGPGAALAQGRGILGSIGWAALLPLLLAMLGKVFEETGVGRAIADVARDHLPTNQRALAVVAYGLSMAALTAVLGNAFAAFGVVTAGIGVPILVGQHGAHPAALGAIGMLTGYCGTLFTPMAANFNIVPAALLNLDDKHAVIKAQAPTGAVLLCVNLVFLYLFALP